MSDCNLPIMDLANDLSWIVNLYRLGRRLEESLPPERLFRLVLERLVDIFEAQDGSLAVLDGQGNLVIGASLHLPADFIGRTVGEKDSPLDRVVRSREPLLIDGDYRDHTPGSTATSERNGQRPASSLCWPLNSGDKLIGAMCLNRYAGAPPFTQPDLARGQVLLELAGIVIDNHILYHAQQRRLEEITKAKQALEAAQSQLVQSEKLASIGQLAAGVAHEINNPVGYVYSNLNTLEKYLTQLFGMIAAFESAVDVFGAPAREAIRSAKQTIDYDFLKADIDDLIHECRDGLDRVRKIVLDLKDFSRAGNRDEWEWADLRTGLESTLNVVWNELKYKAEVIREYADIPAIRCLPSQLNQVFMNLLVNASQAIREKGVITVRTGQEDNGVFVEIADTGCGIPAENLDHIFEPFFTTKPVGKGTGLGLSISFNVVGKHGGKIDVVSGPGAGTTFHIWLPIDHSDAGATPTETALPT